MRGYYTVVLINSQTGQVKTLSGIRANGRFEAVKLAVQQVSDPSQWKCKASYLSKRRKLAVSTADRWTRGRSRHEVREQGRKIWAVLAKAHTVRGPLAVKTDWTLQYHLVIARAHMTLDTFATALPFESGARLQMMGGHLRQSLHAL